jgi:hypothetical protein
MPEFEQNLLYLYVNSLNFANIQQFVVFCLHRRPQDFPKSFVCPLFSSNSLWMDGSSFIDQCGQLYSLIKYQLTRSRFLYFVDEQKTQTREILLFV